MTEHRTYICDRCGARVMTAMLHMREGWIEIQDNLGALVVGIKYGIVSAGAKIHLCPECGVSLFRWWRQVL